MHEKLANTDFCNLEKPDYFEIREKANKFLYGDWHGFSYVLESAFAIVGKVLDVYKRQLEGGVQFVLDFGLRLTENVLE